MAAPTFVDDDEVAGGTSTTVSFNWGNLTGEADNDVAVVMLYGEAAADPTSIPTGWALYHSWDQTTGGFKYRSHVYWRRRSGDTGAITFTFAGNVWRSGRLGLYRGCITSETPLLPSTPDEDIEAAQNTQPSHPGITVARANSGALFASWAFAAGTIVTDPTGYQFRDSTSSEVHFWDDLTTTPGATGTVAASLADPEYCSEILIELVTEAVASAAITGTATATINEADIVAGGKTIIETLTSATFLPAAGTPTYSTGTAKSTTTAPGRTGNGDLTISFPPSYTPTAGHFAAIFLYHDQGTGTTPSGGWAQVTGSPFGSGTEKLQIFWKVLAGGESDPVSTISGSGVNVSHCANMAIYTGVGSIGAIGTASAGSGTPMTAAAITTTANNSIVIGVAGRGDNENSSGQTFGGSSTGVNERLDGGTDQGNDSQVSMADISIATSGTSSGAFSSTTSATDPWVCVQLELKPSTPFNDARQAIINGLDSAQAEGTGWDAVVKAGLEVTTVVRTSDTVVTITLSAFGSYNITAQETITVTVPAAALVSGGPVTGSPTFTVDTSGATATVVAALKKVTANLNAEQRDLITINATLIKTAASISANMNGAAEIDTIVKKVVASLLVSHQQRVTVGTTLAKVTANVNLQQEQRLTVTSTIAKTTAALNLAVRPELTITTTLRKTTAALNASQRQELSVATTLAKVTSALNVDLRPELSIATTLRPVQANLNAEQRYLLTVASTLSKVTASLNAEQRYLATIATTLAKVTASLNVDQAVSPEMHIATTLAKVQANLNASQRYESSIASSLENVTAALSVYLRPEMSIATTLAKVTANVNLDTRALITIASTLAHLTAALAANMRPELHLSATLAHVTASLAASQRDLLTIDSDLRPVAASLNLQQRYLITVASTLAHAVANLNLTQSQRLTVATVLAHLTANVNLFQTETYALTITATLARVLSDLHIEFNSGSINSTLAPVEFSAHFFQLLARLNLVGQESAGLGLVGLENGAIVLEGESDDALVLAGRSDGAITLAGRSGAGIALIGRQP